MQVVFSVKELLIRLDAKLDEMGKAMALKAEIAELTAMRGRIETLEKEAVSTSVVKANTEELTRQAGRTRWLAWALAVNVAVMLIGLFSLLLRTGRTP